jgi:thioredoxin-dependent peroxiredoxin
MLEIGHKAPDFSAPDQDGNTIHLAELHGKWVALWWYPKASTRG